MYNLYVADDRIWESWERNLGVQVLTERTRKKRKGKLKTEGKTECEWRVNKEGENLQRKRKKEEEWRFLCLASCVV